MRANPREHGRTEGIESLGQIQTARSRRGLAKNRDIRIGCDLKYGDSRSQYHQGNQENGERRNSRCRIENEASNDHGCQTDDDCLLIANPVDHLRRWNRKEEISGEEGCLNQHASSDLEIKNMLREWD